MSLNNRYHKCINAFQLHSYIYLSFPLFQSDKRPGIMLGPMKLFQPVMQVILISWIQVQIKPLLAFSILVSQSKIDRTLSFFR